MNTIEQYVLEMIGENPDSPDVFTDDSTGMAHIRDSIGEAIEEICLVTGAHRKTWLLPLEANMGFYQIISANDAFGWAVSVWYPATNKRLRQKSISWLACQSPRWLYNTGTPEIYAPVGTGKICLWPAPAADTEAIQIEAVAIPKPYSYDDEPIKLIDSHQWAAAQYAVSEYWASRGDAKTAVYHFKEYLKLMQIADQVPDYNDRRWQYRSVKRDVA